MFRMRVIGKSTVIMTSGAEGTENKQTEGSVKCLLGLGSSVDSTRYFSGFFLNKLLFVPDMFEFFIVHLNVLENVLEKVLFSPANVLEFDYTLSVGTLIVM